MSAKTRRLAQVPYGAVYFRKSNPPGEDWARDYQTAAEDGMNLFRHWFLWSAIEVAPGEFDWADYDRQLDLAAAHGIGTIIAEMLTAAPEWAWRRYAHARYLDATGRLAISQISGSCATGGFPGLCLDNLDVLTRAGQFLTGLAERYRGHPGLAGYDVWNECNIPRQYCYCPATLARFREWLQAHYGTPREVGLAWHRYSYADWEDVQAPRALGPHPEVLDWLQFRIDNAYRLLRWRVETLRQADPHHLIAAHGIASTLSDMAGGACDEWRSAAEVQTWGFTWVASRKGSEPWKQWHAADLVRAGSGGKSFWHAEAQAGPLWMQPQVVGRSREDGRISEPEDVRLWNMTSFAAGATGILYPRWRPLLDGPLFGAFGAYGMDGSRTPRSQMTSQVAEWANAPEQASLWQARPVDGNVAILVVPESQFFAYAQQGNTDYYAQAARGAYQGFFENNVQADWARLEDLAGPDGLDRYRFAYLPYPIYLTTETARQLRQWVASGGTLVSEGCPAYWSDLGHTAHVGAVQPNAGLDELFGVREAYVEFTPDLLTDLELTWQGLRVPGGVFMQAYEPLVEPATSMVPPGQGPHPGPMASEALAALVVGSETEPDGVPAGAVSEAARVTGHYLAGAAGPAAGRAAVVEHRYGHGRTLLIGTFPGYGHFHRPSAGSKRFFASLLAWAGVQPHVRVLSEQAARVSPQAQAETLADTPAKVPVATPNEALVVEAAEEAASAADRPGLPGGWRGVTARLHVAEAPITAGGMARGYLWITNPALDARTVTLELSEQTSAWLGTLRKAQALWPEEAETVPIVEGRRITVTVGGRDAAVLHLVS